MHLQREGDEHCGSGNAGASLLKKRLSRNNSVAGHAPDPPTTLTAVAVILAVLFIGITFVADSFGATQPAPGIGGPPAFCTAWVREGRDRTIRITAGLLSAQPTGYAQPKESWGRVAQWRLYDGIRHET